ncbi:hypothetical protein EV215_0770 [Hypnocyclicus thermotrophus]|uniref:DUF374 domain-containing protein n=1 Tax=Hypnocyclicus thermotrophus TaxID=1627895 RepID=A0AA46I690_9FUSO|nr:lysophospholipid acyltransferase family protein [Hypnocyclicus thermotrophus]TDT71397.1 hypothetical protein EV215_0770 [Hypnocyclicus thermotrophus]
METKKKKNIKKEKKYRKYGYLLYYLIKFITLTMRNKVVKHKEIKEKNYIYGFWHEKIIFPSMSLSYLDKVTTLVSPSRDGELLSVILKKFGYDVIRGSSNDKNIRSLMSMIKHLKRGYSLGFAVDGPRGPIYQIKPGIVFMAQKTGVEILPIGGAFSKKIVFKKAWDKFQFPLPFSKSVTYIGKPIKIEKDVNIEEYIEVINQKIHEANKEAERILNEK